MTDNPSLKDRLAANRAPVGLSATWGSTALTAAAALSLQHHPFPASLMLTALLMAATLMSSVPTTLLITLRPGRTGQSPSPAESAAWTLATAATLTLVLAAALRWPGPVGSTQWLAAAAVLLLATAFITLAALRAPKNPQPTGGPPTLS